MAANALARSLSTTLARLPRVSAGTELFSYGDDAVPFFSSRSLEFVRRELRPPIDPLHIVENVGPDVLEVLFSVGGNLINKKILIAKMSLLHKGAPRLTLGW